MTLSFQQLTEAATTDVLVRSVRSTEIDEYPQQLLDWHLRYDQLDEGRFTASFTDVRIPGIQLFVESTTRRVRQRGHLMPNSFAIGTLLAGDGAVSINAQRADANSLIAVYAKEIDACTPANCTLAGLVIDAPLLRHAAQCAPPLSTLLAGASLLSMTVSPNALVRLRTLLLDVVQSAMARPTLMHDVQVRQQLQDDLLAHVIDAMFDAQPIDKVQRADARKRMVDRACDLLLAQPDAPPTLLEVCHQIGASPRKLSYGFQEVLGLSPARYIKIMRLNAVRRTLRQGNDQSHGEGLAASVHRTALQWGFWHFGHFAADYKKQFDELPSDTLRYAREETIPR